MSAEFCCRRKMKTVKKLQSMKLKNKSGVYGFIYGFVVAQKRPAVGFWD